MKMEIGHTKMYGMPQNTIPKTEVYSSTGLSLSNEKISRNLTLN